MKKDQTDPYIDIFYKGGVTALFVWAGRGRVNDRGVIYDCAAQLGSTPEASEQVYAAIEQQLVAGAAEGTVEGDDDTYTWVKEGTRGT